MRDHKQKRGKRERQASAGFTLTELTIIIAIISVLVAIAMPSIAQVKIGANEAGAERALNAYRNAFVSFQLDSGTFAYPTNLNQLNGYVDGALAAANAQRNGYNFTLVNSARTTYAIIAQPAELNVLGTKTLLLTESGTVENISNIGFQQAVDRGLGPMLNLANNFTDLSGTNEWMSNGAVEQTIGGIDVIGSFSNWMVNWDFKNTLDKAIDLIIAVTPRFVGANIAAAATGVLTDGLLKTDANSSADTAYVNFGKVEAGGTVRLDQYISSWTEARLTPYEFNGISN
jgi:type IV pilus assembly protein PilA